MVLILFIFVYFVFQTDVHLKTNTKQKLETVNKNAVSGLYYIILPVSIYKHIKHVLTTS